MRHYIYKIINPSTNSVFYVGQTSNPESRAKQHLADFMAKSPNSGKRAEYIWSLKSEPVFEIIETIEVDNYWPCSYGSPLMVARREAYWIEHYLNLGCDMCNISWHNDDRYLKSLGSHLPESIKRQIMAVIAA